MAEKGRVVVAVEYGKPFEMREYELPDPEPGAIVVKIVQAGICGTDLHIWRGDSVAMAIPSTGRVMGHEGFGVVYKLGKGVSTDSTGIPIKEGDRLMHYGIFPCNRCHYCLKGLNTFCTNRPFPTAGKYPYFSGTYSDFINLPPAHPVFRIPDELPDDILAPVNCALGTVAQGLINAGATEGHYVVVIGAGGLGLNAAAFAKDMGANRVIAVDRLENRLTLAKEFGADFTINVHEYDTPEARIQRVKELTNGRGADIVMELVGRADILPEGIEMLAPGGTFLEIGDILKGEVSIDPSRLILGKRVMGSLLHQPSLLPIILEYLVKTQDKVPFHKIVSHKFKLDDINEVFPKAEWNQRQTDVTRAALVP